MKCKLLVLTATALASIAGSTTAQAHSTTLTPGIQIVQLRSQISHDIAVINKKYVLRHTSVFMGWTQLVQVVLDRENIAFHRRHYVWATHKLVKLWALLGNVSAWSCIHYNPRTGTGEGAWNDSGDPYWGGLQMDRSFQQHYGSDMIRAYHGYANIWHPFDQMIVAQRAYRSGRGYYPWPNTARACGLI